MHSYKYGFTGKTQTFYHNGNEIVVRQIIALRDVVEKDGTIIASRGEIGGWIQSEKNLSQGFDGAWIKGNAIAFEDSRVSDDALMTGNSKIYERARMTGDTYAYGGARMYGSSILCEEAEIGEQAQLHGHAMVGGRTVLNGYVRVCGSTRMFSSERVEYCKDEISETPKRETEAE